MRESPDVAATTMAPAWVYLTQGAVHCAAVPTVVSTILGSCVAVCLWDSRRRCGGINHFVLPKRNVDMQNPRFGDVAIAQLVDGMRRLGCATDQLQAKIFGGAAVLPVGLSGDTVGNQNVRLALERLQAYGIPVIAWRTGGRHGLLIRLFTESGEVLVHRLAATPRTLLEPASASEPHISSRRVLSKQDSFDRET